MILYKTYTKRTFIVFIIIFIKHINSFTGYNVNGREVPPWTEYKYFEDVTNDIITREYALQEANQRTYLMCPKGNKVENVHRYAVRGENIKKDSVRERERERQRKEMNMKTLK